MAKNDIRTLVDSFVADLEQHIRAAALEAVQDALANGQPAPKKATRKGRSSKKKAGRRSRRSPAQIEAAKTKIVSYVRSNPGAAMGDLSSALNQDSATLRPQVNELLEAGTLRKEGEKRGTKYFAGKARAARKTKTKAKGRKKTTRKKTRK